MQKGKKMKALNRKEFFLESLANGEESKIKPLTRKEILLKKQAERESESSGTGGLGIPTYTKDEMTQELAVELAKNKAMFFYDMGITSGSDYAMYEKPLITKYRLNPEKEGDCGDVDPPELGFYNGREEFIKEMSITTEMYDEIKAAWGL